MKRIGNTVAVVFMAVLAVTGCTFKVKAEAPALAKIEVHVSESVAGQAPRSADGLEIRKGAKVVLIAEGVDKSGKPVEVEPTWVSSATGYVDITPAKGERVTVKGLKRGTVNITVQDQGKETVVRKVRIK